jgi:hypothetical protein
MEEQEREREEIEEIEFIREENDEWGERWKVRLVDALSDASYDTVDLSDGSGLFMFHPEIRSPYPLDSGALRNIATFLDQRNDVGRALLAELGL